MTDALIRLEALRLAHDALCSGKFSASELMQYAHTNYAFLKPTKKAAKKRSK